MSEKKPRRLESLVLRNKNGGLYQPGRAYDIRDKLNVATVIQEEERRNFPYPVNVSRAASNAKVSRKFVRKVQEELQVSGKVLDPPFHKTVEASKEAYAKLSKVQGLFLLALRADNPARTNTEYVYLLRETFNVDISTTSISRFFLEKFRFKGKFKVPTLVPIDKFKIGNRGRYFEFIAKVNLLKDHSRWVFFDEKHLVNSDVIKCKVRANPLTGYVDSIGVPGDFRESYNLLAAISMNPLKGRPMVYTLGKNNGTAEAFMNLIRGLLLSGWLWRGDVVCLDNACVHTGGEAKYLQELLWNWERDGAPLYILLVFLPTRAPELNPIELIFHILARRIQSRRSNTGEGPCDKAVVKYATAVMHNMSFELMARCYKHCGY